MLDVGFSEILLTSAIALIVLGPEKLPKVARQVGNWVGRARAMARQLTEQLEREVSAEELMKQTKASDASSNRPPPNSDPAPFDTSYIPNPPTTVASPEGAAPAPASAPAAAYSPETAAAVHGADWHPTPPENKAANE
ncbi:MAG TPA: Sec-independent protein translocase protein TatB [Steroidobacteraceae bacterium]|jgi:sec-independent protein translocase protein TatB|nr:Sec-independent protein translocase protein TatB [Steroidobacteraceae bacterium]